MSSLSAENVCFTCSIELDEGNQKGVFSVSLNFLHIGMIVYNSTFVRAHYALIPSVETQGTSKAVGEEPAAPCPLLPVASEKKQKKRHRI